LCFTGPQLLASTSSERGSTRSPAWAHRSPVAASSSRCIRCRGPRGFAPGAPSSRRHLR
jgi:hypothetical protein